MDSVVFRGYVERIWVVVLRPGDVVVMDNLSPHKILDVQEAIEAPGATIHYLPLHSPDFNPIEFTWSKVKQHLRFAAARTHGQLARAVGGAMRSITPADCRVTHKLAGWAAAQIRT